ncbi:multi-tm2 domain protein [Saccharibacillus sacchari]|uniref:Multi-tm2 domain protein n=1 Tax=Saccharibacillus sacchari TaxID=456493 RepID=A0ACC6PCQ1_9BACL
MNQQRSAFAALLLNIVPGLGHLYWGRRIRSFFYFLIALGIMALGILVSIDSYDDAPLGIALVFWFMVWLISMFDLLAAVLNSLPKRQTRQMQAAYFKQDHVSPHGQGFYGEYPDEAAYRAEQTEMEKGMPPHMEFGSDEMPGYSAYPPPIGQGHMLREPEYFSDSQRFLTILLSFLPGLGHLYMGLIQRGVSFLAAFFGLTTVLVFITGFTGEESFLLFLGVLPIIWVYGMFDAVQLAEKKRRGEKLQDYSLIAKWDMGSEKGRKSRTMGLLLAIVPGAAHMYLGLMKRGTQFMILFFGSIYILDVFGLSLFLFLVPLIWFYAFFDALQQVGRYGQEVLQDRALLGNRFADRKWLGVLLVLLGSYYIFGSILIPFFFQYIPSYIKAYLYGAMDYFSDTLVALLLIGGGIRLMLGKRSKA